LLKPPDTIHEKPEWIAIGGDTHMITNHRMGLKIWRIQRIKIPGITETKRKPLDYKARQRVGMIASRKKPSHTKAFSP